MATATATATATAEEVEVEATTPAPGSCHHTEVCGVRTWHGAWVSGGGKQALA